MKPKKIEPDHTEVLARIGCKIKELRKRKNIGYIEFARKAGLSRNTYNQLEKGKVYFNFSTLLLVLDFHEIEVTDFFSEL